MNRYNIELINKIENKKLGTRKQIEYKRKDNKQMTLGEIDKIYHQMINTLKLNPNKISIHGLGNERLSTLKQFDKELFADDYEDYLENKPEDIQEKLENFFTVNFIIYQ